MGNQAKANDQFIWFTAFRSVLEDVTIHEVTTDRMLVLCQDPLGRSEHLRGDINN